MIKMNTIQACNNTSASKKDHYSKALYLKRGQPLITQV